MGSFLVDVELQPFVVPLMCPATTKCSTTSSFRFIVMDGKAKVNITTMDLVCDLCAADMQEFMPSQRLHFEYITVEVIEL